LLPPAFAQTPPASSDFIGSTVCKACHPDVWLNFYKNPHYKSIASGDLPPEKTGCEGCHGPGKAHVEARGGRSTIPHAFSLMDTRQTLEDCLKCHAKNFSKVNIWRSSHTMADVACTACHSIHKSTVPLYLLAKKQADLCYTCHVDVRSQFSMPFKHRVNEGVMTCTDCHNPHGAFAPTWRMGNRPYMVHQALGNEIPCVKCHTDKRGPWVFEHGPVKVEGCDVCHYPHGATNAKLLRRPVVFTLCLECHNDPSPPDGGSGVLAQSATHNMLDPRYRQCTACHVRIHGSNSDQFFLR
jgi:DmsE family decaheme c-type cytochrome